MELLKSLLKAVKAVFPFADFTYLLQQEEYSLQRVWFWLPRFFLKRNFQSRDRLVYTLRAKLTIGLAIVLFALLIIFNYLFYKSSVVVILTLLLIPVIIIVANSLLSPIFNCLKFVRIRKAGAYFKANKGKTKVIAIAGSYGKTTTKNFIEQLLKQSYRTQVIPGNINSSMGIANWILDYFEKGVDVLIVEMDAYRKNEIAESVKLAAPDFAIITNIGDQHLQRFKTKENLAKCLFELFQFCASNAIRITNRETAKYLLERGLEAHKVVAVDNTSNHLVSASHNSNFAYAVKVAEYLNIPMEYVNQIAKNVIIPERRQESKNLFGFEAIDDSYNISYTTALVGIEESSKKAKQANKKLLIITAGIPELAVEDKNKNKLLGEVLGQKADKIFILKSIFYKEIVGGVKQKDKTVVFANLSDAVDELQKHYLSSEWFVLLQPELTDLYY